MEIRLDGKTALVTGGSRGIGKAIAAAFAEAGASVMLSSRKANDLEEAAADLKGDVAWHAANAGRPEEAEATVAATIERFGSCDILVNNAAANPYMGKTIDVDMGAYQKIMDVNLRGPLTLTQAAWRQSMQEKGGSVINISSIGGMSYGGFIGVYDNSKAALIHQTKHFAVELAPKVRVNAIAPGLVKTDFARALWEQNGDKIAQAWPLKRLGEPEDIAGAALFLASDLSSWMTGQVLVVDGGALLQGGGA